MGGLAVVLEDESLVDGVELELHRGAILRREGRCGEPGGGESTGPNPRHAHGGLRPTEISAHKSPFCAGAPASGGKGRPRDRTGDGPRRPAAPAPIHTLAAGTAAGFEIECDITPQLRNWTIGVQQTIRIYA